MFQPNSSSSTSTSLGINYISNPDCETGTSNWALYDNTTTVTFTNGSANIVVNSATGLYVGMPLLFGSNGSLPTNFVAGTTYYIITIASTTITVSASLGGTAVSAGSAGSGTHTLYPFVPTTGTGGSPFSITFSLDAVVPLRGVNSFLLQKSGGYCAGQGVSTAFTIDPTDQAKVLKVSFDYKAFHFNPSTGAAGSDSDLEIWVYDVTNAAVIPVSPKVLTGGNTGASFNGTFTFTGYFQTASNSTSYRLCIHGVGNASLSYQFEWDNVYVGPQTVNYGEPVTDWVNYGANTITATTTNPTKGTMVTDNFWARRIGDSAQCRIEYRQSVAGASGSGDYIFLIPPALGQIDTTKCTAYNTVEGAGAYLMDNCVGYWHWTNNTSIIHGAVVVYDQTGVRLFGVTSSNGLGVLGSGELPLSQAATIAIEIEFTVPIKGWSSNLIMSSDTDTRVVAAKANTTANTTLGAEADFIPATTVYDTHGGYSSSTGYTVPVAGYYHVNMQFLIATTSTTMTLVGKIQKNGTTQGAGITVVMGATAAQQGCVNVECTILCAVGDVLKGRMSASAGSPTLDATAADNFFEVQRISGPATMAATESVNMRASVASPTGTIASTFAGAGTAVFSSTVFDSHGGYDTSGGKYTVRIPGKYLVNAHVRVSGSMTDASSFVTAAIGKNGAEYANGLLTYATTTASTAIDSAVTCLMSCVAGDTIEVRAVSNAGSAAWQSDAMKNYLEIVRVGN